MPGALILEPEILILDEPTSELDPIGKDEVFEVLERLRRERSITVIMVEHAAEQLAEMADRIVVMQDGLVVDQATARTSCIAIHSCFTGRRRSARRKSARCSSSSFRPACWPRTSSPHARRSAWSDCARCCAASRRSSMPEPAIEVRDVVFRYTTGGADVLRGVDLRIEHGDFVALVGQNGAGKTTLAKQFNGLLKPSAGSVRVMGRDTRNAPVADMARAVGYVYQNPDHQIFAQRVRAEAAFGPRNLGLTEAEVARRVEEALALVGLQEQADEFAFSLGRGQRQKLAVASVLAMEPPILVIDEPTTGLDQAGARGILDLLSRWNREGRTIVAIAHDMSLVAERIPRTVVVNDGRILADGPTREVLSDAALLHRAFLRPPQVTRIAQRLADLGIKPDTLTVPELYAQIAAHLEHV